MNKRQNPADVLDKRTTVRYKSAEYQTVKRKANEAGLSFSDFCRQMTLEGYVQAVHTPHNINEIRIFKNLLLEYKTHFSRISNMIKSSDPILNTEILQLKKLYTDGNRKNQVMIGKAKSNKSLQATIAYNNKEKATLIYANKLVGMSLADFQMQMEDLQKCYRGYSKQLIIHAILSPSIEDGKRLTESQWKEIADKYLMNMNMQELQAIGFLHADKEHKHLHLVINKVKEENFKLFHDNYIGKKSQNAADTIAKDMKLIRAMEVRQARINESVKIKDTFQARIEKPIGTKQRFKSILEAVIKNNHSSIDEYFTDLKRAGFKVHSYINKETGVLRGYGVEMNGVKMDASDIGKKFTLKTLKISEFDKNNQRVINERDNQRRRGIRR